MNRLGQILCYAVGLSLWIGFGFSISHQIPYLDMVFSGAFGCFLAVILPEAKKK